jgi:hypothetical protein
VLRAELDAWYARAHGLTRDELRHILDPADVKGPDYPSETFRVLKKNEIARYGEYRTARLVLAAGMRRRRGSAGHAARARHGSRSPACCRDSIRCRGRSTPSLLGQRPFDLF